MSNRLILSAAKLNNSPTSAMSPGAPCRAGAFRLVLLGLKQVDAKHWQQNDKQYLPKIEQRIFADALAERSRSRL
jgi:hypothetical protein